MPLHDDESGEFKALKPAADPASIDLLREILGRPDGDSALAAAPDAHNLPRLLADPRFQELIEIVNLAVQIHGVGTQEWFVRPEPELGFVLPATLMRDPANGRKLVKQSLMNHLKGAYAIGQGDRVLPQGRPVTAPAPAPALHGTRKPRLPKPKKRPRA